jgi:hypothetical protein
MKRLRTRWALLVDTLVVAAQRLLGLLRGSAQCHILITGPDHLGMKHLAMELGRLVPELQVSSSKKSALATASDFAPVVMSVDLDDVTRSAAIERTIGRFRKAIVLAPVADPRALVCAKRPDVPHEWAEGFDYRFSFGSGGTKSFTEPGVLPRFEGLEAWRDTGATVISPAREVLEADISSVFHQLADALEDAPSPRIRSALRKAASSAAPLTRTPRWNEDKGTATRALGQISVSPALETTAVSFGYAPKSSLTKARAPKATRGTIIAFHTPDEVYTAEANRLRSSLDALGLEYKIIEVQPEQDWVRTTLLKPSWIIKARDEISGPLLYVDVDAIVHEDPWPYLSQYDSDLAAFVLPHGGFASGTVFINDTTGARQLLQEWLNRSEQRVRERETSLSHTGDDGDQGVLKEVVLALEAEASPMSFGRLPVNFTHIFDRVGWYFTYGPIVIEHLQASREVGGHQKRLDSRRERLLQLEAGATSTS